MTKLDDKTLLLQIIYNLDKDGLHDLLTFIQGYETCKQQIELTKSSA